MTNSSTPLEAVETIKSDSRYLRGTIAEGLSNPITGSLSASDTQLTKFHGIYQQDNRDLRVERQQQKLEPDYRFMVRARVPGGVCSSAQWQVFTRLAEEYGNQGLRLTTRQAVQIHGIIKQALKPTLQAINDSLLDTLAACGDVNRNVMCSVFPEHSQVHRESLQVAEAISAHLTPATGAYHELWLNGEPVSSQPDIEPIYGPTYLPRKFKIAVAVPPRNDVDVFAHDLGFIAIESNGQLLGFNVTAGGGMGVTHQNPQTYPRRADLVGFCPPDQVLAVAEAMVTIQRDFGDRSNRKHARFKYTIAERGLDWLSEQLAERLGAPLEQARPMTFSHSGDQFGWQQGDDGTWALTLFVENGRIIDQPNRRLHSALDEIASLGSVEFRLTPNQNVLLARIDAQQRSQIDALLAEHQVSASPEFSPLRLNSMACVALPTCALAMAESERYLPDLITRVESLLARHGLSERSLTMRMTGCPNGCARPYMAEIGLIGKSLGHYKLLLGGSVDGTRLNRPYREHLDEAAVLAHLDELLGRFAAEASIGQSFGDFIWSSGLLEDQVNDRRYNDQPEQWTDLKEVKA